MKMIVRDLYLHTTDSRQLNAVCYLECVRRARSVMINGILMQSSDSQFTTSCSLPRRWLNHCLIFEDMLIVNIVVTTPIGFVLITSSTLIELLYSIQKTTMVRAGFYTVVMVPFFSLFVYRKLQHRKQNKIRESNWHQVCEYILIQ